MRACQICLLYYTEYRLFTRTLDRIKDTLQEMTDLNRLRRILHSSDMITKLQQCNAAIGNMMELFIVRFLQNHDAKRLLLLFQLKSTIEQHRITNEANTKLDQIMRQTSTVIMSVRTILSMSYIAEF